MFLLRLKFFCSSHNPLSPYRNTVFFSIIVTVELKTTTITIKLWYLALGFSDSQVYRRPSTLGVKIQGSKLRLTGRQCDQKLSTGD